LFGLTIFFPFLIGNTKSHLVFTQTKTLANKT